MNKFLVLVVFTSFCLNKSFAFQDSSFEIREKDEVYKPDILSTHPFGVFFNRLQGNFRHNPINKTQISINYNSGNVWGTPITTYIPSNEENKIETHGSSDCSGGC